MLINEIVDFCDEIYTSQDTKHICKSCNHEIKCSGDCKNCLKEIHFPNKFPTGKKDYDCPNLINFYVCDYTYKYASEIWYLLRKCKSIDDLDKYHIMSIGCGGCPDLMAFESYLSENNSTSTISYKGIDINKLWKPVHSKIGNYQSEIITKYQFKYVDAIEFFNENFITSTNVLILQYVISHFYNTKQISKIEKFFDDLIDNIILHKEKGEPLIVIISDVNSNNRGRDYFLVLCKKLGQKHLEGTYSQYYFDYDIKSDFQRYGNKHKSNKVLYTLPSKLDKYNPWRECSSAQLLIEIK